MKIVKYIALGIFVLLVSAAIVAYYAYSELNSKLDIDEEIIVIIPQNANIDQIVRILNSYDIFEPAYFYEIAMKLYAKYGGGTFYAGSYKFSKMNTNKHVIESIFSGKNLHILRVTYPEGITLKRFAKISQSVLGIDESDFLRIASTDSILNKYGVPGKSAEGYLMPDTYEFFYGVEALELVQKIMDHHLEIWDKRFAARAEEIGMSKHEALTLASIIESETQVAEERSIVSGVYHNRLKKGWLLEADPTVQYALGEKRRLLYRDLEINNPYNTYKYPGLPPGPINNPGKGSIEAALYPAIHDYMFFVALGDGSGKHNFAKSYSEHLSNVKIFRRNVRANR
jgi:UPF0755 protein